MIRRSGTPEMPDALTREREHAHMLQRLGDLFAVPERAFAVHYALQRLRRGRDDRAPPVAAIALRNLGTGALRIFSIKAEADRAKLNIASAANSPRDLLHLEYSMLFGLDDFFEQHPEAMFVHWYMRDAHFGFAALELRQRLVTSQVVAGIHGERSVATAIPFGFGTGLPPLAIRVPEERRIDLARLLHRLYGIGQVGLRPLAEANGLSLAELIDGKDEPMAFAEGNYARLAWSSATKARLIAELATLAHSGTITQPAQRPARSAERPTRVFINYRRRDSQAEANWLHEILSEQFGDDNVFIDTDDIPPGSDYDEVLREQIARCDVFLALIGMDWTNAVDEKGHRRLGSENDYVRLEIRTALTRSIQVVPVLLGDTRMPSETDLPPDILPLRRKQAVALRIPDFRADAARLIAQIREARAKRTTAEAGPPRSHMSA